MTLTTATAGDTELRERDIVERLLRTPLPLIGVDPKVMSPPAEFLSDPAYHAKLKAARVLCVRHATSC